MLIEFAKECIACDESFEYFCDKYIRFTNPTSGIQNLTLLPYQRNLIEDIQNNKYIVLKKYRNGKFSTTMLAYGLWNFLFKKDQHITWVEGKHEDAEHTSLTLKLIIDLLPEWMVRDINKEQLLFSALNNTFLFGTPQEVFRNESELLIINDAAFIKDMDYHWKTLFPRISAKGKCIIMSSINQFEPITWFDELFDNAKKNKTWFHIHKTNYKDNPIYYDQEYCNQMRTAMGEAAWRAEVLMEKSTDL